MKKGKQYLNLTNNKFNPNIKTMKKIISIFIILILIISCKKEEKAIKLNKQKFSISINFPDTVHIYKGYDGKIDYENDLDTITKTLNKLNPLRTLVYTFLVNNKVNYTNQYLKKIVVDTFYTENNREIPIYVEFNKVGINYIDGIITDEVVIENGGKNKKGKLMNRVITNEFRVTKKVVVIGTPAVRSL